MNDVAITKSQQKRRSYFKAQAKKSLKSYTIQSLKNKLKNSDYPEWNQDYHAMISQGKKIKLLSMNEFRVFVQAVYGWMPVLYSQQSVKNLKKSLLVIMSDKEIDRKIIDEAARCFTSNKHSAGSISALSKTLHFCSPEKFPVWDTRVARALGRKTGTGNNIVVYLDYLSVMSDLKSDESLENYYEYYKKAIDSRATRLRAFEHGLYLKGSKKR